VPTPAILERVVYVPLASGHTIGGTEKSSLRPSKRGPQWSPFNRFGQGEHHLPGTKRGANSLLGSAQVCSKAARPWSGSKFLASKSCQSCLAGGREINALFEGVLPTVHVFNEEESRRKAILSLWSRGSTVLT